MKYDKSGNQLTTVYNAEGEDTLFSYSMNGTPIQEFVSATLASVGALKYWQAFCIYNGKYYSTNGSNIAEQDNSFSVLRDTTIDVGHGNSLQLGNNGKAYASGWDDQTIYIVNLATLAVSGTISLPTEGYTTAAVDDVNQIAYIFQRDTRPNTEAIYNFIVYDYANEEILSTRQTSVAFGAMQACDMVDGKIFVLNGTGTEELPNGYRWYDTKGKLLGGYLISSQSSNEPEGVFIDRATGRQYISYVDKNLYYISGIS